MPSKYSKLTAFLNAGEHEPTKLTMNQIDIILAPESLAPSARAHPAWWLNNDPSHSQCLAWDNAGYIAHADVGRAVVEFWPK